MHHATESPSGSTGTSAQPPQKPRWRAVCRMDVPSMPKHDLCAPRPFMRPLQPHSQRQRSGQMISNTNHHSSQTINMAAFDSNDQLYIIAPADFESSSCWSASPVLSVLLNVRAGVVASLNCKWGECRRECTHSAVGFAM